MAGLLQAPNQSTSDQVAYTGVRRPLVETKIDPPIASPWLISRDDLVDRLDRAESKLSLICAPAGWGKTSLITAWLAARPGTHLAFVHLEADDDDSASFWAYVLAALSALDLGLEIPGDPEQLLGTPGIDPMLRIVPQLLNEFRSLETSLVLVLDDYHVLSEQQIHNSVHYLIEHLPQSVRVAISTRVDPPLPLGRLRASGEMIELRAKQLRLTADEAEHLLLDRFGLELDASSIELLCRRTEGWPAGIQLAGLALEEEPDPAAFVQHFAGDDRNIADYLTGEVLERLPPDIVRLLTRTSVLERLSGPLCDSVADAEGSAQILSDLEHHNLFLVPLDHQREWYRYHHLFGEWLRHELRRREPDGIQVLHSRAADWLEEQGSLEAAISHALAAGDEERAAEIMDRYLADGAAVNWTAVFRWLGRLPIEIKERHPLVAIAQVRLAFTKGDLLGGRQWLPRARRALAETAPEIRQQAEVTVRLFTALSELVTGDMDRARRLFTEIADEEREDASQTFAIAIGYAGTAAFWAAGPLQAMPALSEAVVAQERTSQPYTGVSALLAAAYAEISDWSAAETTAASALALPPPQESPLYPFQMPAHYALGQVHCARGRSEEGVAELTIGLEQARAWVEPIFVAYGCLLLADCLDDYSEKRALIREARQLISDGRGRGRIGDLVAAAERKLSLRQPSQSTSGTVHVLALTNRERDVLRWMRSELSFAEIAREMYVSYNTVKGHAKSIYRKLGVTSRAAAVETSEQLDLL